MAEDTTLVAALTDLRVSVDQLRHDLVRKDVYESDRRGDDRRITLVERSVEKLEQENERRDGTMRQLIVAVLSGVLVTVVGAALIAAFIGG